MMSAVLGVGGGVFAFNLGDFNACVRVDGNQG